MASAHSFPKIIRKYLYIVYVTRPSEECDTSRHKIESPVVNSGPDFIVRRKEGQAIEKISGSYPTFSLGNKEMSHIISSDEGMSSL